MKRVRLLVWGSVLAAGMALFAARQWVDSRAQASVEGELGQVPPFSLRDQHGRSVTAASLRGKVWVASFLFTRCRTVCPMLTAKMARFEASTRDLADLELVSISVDPEHDTPEVLAAYADKHGARRARWHFLTGPLGDIEKTVVQGFKMQMGDKAVSEVEPTLVDIVHGEHFVLVDREGAIRGYFRSDEAGLAQLERAARSLP
jgi:protein SCO1/2